MKQNYNDAHMVPDICKFYKTPDIKIKDGFVVNIKKGKQKTKWKNSFSTLKTQESL